MEQYEDGHVQLSAYLDCDVSFIYPLLLYLCAAAQDRVAIVPMGKR